MAHTVEIRPSGRRIENPPDESLLQSALSAGLAVDYGCSNGNCGQCRARRISGEVECIGHCDYAFPAADVQAGWFLMCRHRAAGDLVIETPLAVGSGDIPLQEIEVKVRKVAPLDERFTLLHVQTPRTRRLRFLAGQSASISDGARRCGLPIASCPCDDRNIHFHVPNDPALCPTGGYIAALRAGDTLQLVGPTGDFVLDGDSVRPRIMIGASHGLAPLKSIAEHSLALAPEIPVSLLLVEPDGAPHYLRNLFRSWSDAFEPFSFTIAGGVSAIEAFVAQAAPARADADVYVCGPHELLEAARAALDAHGVDPGCVRELAL